MLQRAAFVTFDISNESAEFCALSIWHACMLATVLSFLFLWVWKKKSPLELHSPNLKCLAAYRAFLLKMQAATLNNLYHLYMITFGGGSLTNSVQNLLCTVTTNFNP
jgi:hypothetical protein